MPFIDIEIIHQTNQDDNLMKILNLDLLPKRYLLVGEVQSGKTSKIIQCINHAYELGYDLAIVFGGTNKILKYQTGTRIEMSKKHTKMEFFSNYKNLSNFTFETFWTGNFFPVVNVLKSYSELGKLISILEDLMLSPKNTDKKILIIDDECDFASINTLKNKGYETKIYSFIKKILSIFKKSCEIKVTATPFANIFNEKFDNILLLKHNEAYTGSSFFSDHIEKYKIIDAYKNNDSQIIEKAVQKSLIFWLLSTGLYIDQTQKNQKSELLINIDLERIKHDEIKKYVVKAIKILLSNPNILKYWVKNEDFKKTFHNVVWSKELLQRIYKACIQILNYFYNNKMNSILILNSFNDDYKTGEHDYAIIIGGVKISRGFTFEHLVTELILNAPNENIAIDVLLQRARWFGYRHKYDDIQKYMSIFMNDKILKAYKCANETIDFFNKNYSRDNIKELLLIYEKNNLKTHNLCLTSYAKHIK